MKLLRGGKSNLRCLYFLARILILCLFILRFYSSPVLKLSECSHTTVIKDMCADCGADLRQNENVSNFLIFNSLKKFI